MKTKLFYVLLLICSYSYSQTFPTNNIQGYYKFNSGAVLVDQAGVVDLTQNGALLTNTTDRFSSNGDAVQLNGDYFSRSNIPTSRSVTHAFWIKTTTNLGNNETIIGDSNRPGAGFNSTTYGYDIHLRDGGILLYSRFREEENNGAFNDRAYGHASSSIVADGTWHHVAVVFYTDRSDRFLNSRIYIDGALDSSNEYDTTRAVRTFPFNTGDLAIGNNRVQNLADVNKYKDEFDDYFVYSRVLDANEIRTLATQDGFCLVPQNNIISASIVTENEATIDVTLNSSTYDVAYGLTSESVTNATVLSNVSSTINLTGLTASTDYNVYIREQCVSGLVSDWSAPISFRTLGRIYVNDTATGLNDGSSWQNAFTDLMSALNIDINGQEIWVAGGTYKTQNPDKNVPFLIDKTNVSLYGGFAGAETLLSQRVLGTNESIISGDTNSNDDQNTLYEIDATRTDNTRRLIVLTAASDNFVIDGFTITAGMASFSADGGAINNIGANNVMVSNCNFFRNGGHRNGGAIYALPAHNGQMTIESCVFEENFSLSGGAVFHHAFGASNTVNIKKSIFLNNTATSSGAAIYSLGFGTINGNLNIDANEFVGNNARSGGAIYANVQSSATLDVLLTNSLFNGNIAEDNSADVGNSGSAAWLRTIGASSTLNSSIVNNTFVNNIDAGSATGLNNFTRASLALTKDNAAATHNATVSNNIFYNNRAANGTTVSKSITGLFETMATVTVENSIDEDNFSSIAAGNKTSTSNADPLFTNAAGSDYTLSAITSPAVNTGNSSAVTTSEDLLGNLRVYGTIVDMGAYEYQCSGCFVANVTVVGDGSVTQTGTFYNSGDNVTLTATPIAGSAFIGWTGDITTTTNPLNINNITSDYNLVATFIKAPIYVDESAVGNNDGTSWANAYTDLQDALALASVDDEIWIAKGTYTPVTPVTPNFPTTAERQVSFNINNNGVILYGGFAGTELQLLDRDMSLIHTTNETILSGDLGGNDDASIAYANATRTDNSFRIVDITDNNIILDGISLSSGNSDATSGEGRFGAALRTAETVTDFTIRKSIIKNNIGMFYTGLALFSDATTSRMAIDACIFENNLSGFGAAFATVPRANRTMHITVTNSLFNNNKTADNSVLNGVGASAGIIRSHYTNSVIYANVVNNTFVNNVNEGTAASDFGTLGISRNNGGYDSSLEVANNIFWGNTKNGGVQALAIGKVTDSNLPSGLIVKHSTDEEGFSNVGTFNNSSADPLFSDAPNGDFTLTNTSPAKNTGVNSSVNTSFDLLGSQRILEVTVDMGAYEYNSTLSTSNNVLSKNDIKLYPNPTALVLNIKMKTLLKSAAVFNMQGQKVIESRTRQIDVSSLSIGVYIIKVEDENGGVITKRFVKQ